ncbi:MAG: GNAT family N-acetyltransferase [Candidatus Bipolaricaulota bacterium]
MNDEGLRYVKTAGDDVAGFLTLLREKTGDYLRPTLRSMGMTWTEFEEMFRSVGEVRAIRQGTVTVGFIWIEMRGSTLHLHGLALEPEFRRQGIGSRVLSDLEDEFRGRAETIELGVHRSNDRARRLYERFGFRKVRSAPGVEFDVLQKRLRRGSPADEP